MFGSISVASHVDFNKEAFLIQSLPPFTRQFLKERMLYSHHFPVVTNAHRTQTHIYIVKQNLYIC